MTPDDVRRFYPRGTRVYATPAYRDQFPRDPRTGVVTGYSEDGRLISVKRSGRKHPCNYDPIFWDLQP